MPEVDARGQGGLLGLAFHPDHALNGLFFVQYVDNAFRPSVVRYRVSANPDVADPASAALVIRLEPIVDHQGGTLAPAVVNTTIASRPSMPA